MRTYISVLLLLSVSFLMNAITAAEKAAPKKEKEAAEAESTEDKPSNADFVFQRKERRDPLFSMLETEKAKLAIANQIKKEESDNNNSTPVDENPTGPENIPEDDHPTADALAKARYYAEQAQVALLNDKWDAAIREADTGLKILKSAQVADQFAEAIRIETLRLNDLRDTARDAQINAQAEDKFNALKIEVQGIMWSADKRSMAIISGKNAAAASYFVQDKIGEDSDAVTIVNIDPNRVDFMITHQRQRFEFKRYLDN